MTTTNTLTIKKIDITPNKITINYEVTGPWSRYFIQNPFWLEYSEDISATPPSIAIVPFICNTLPVAWVNDAEIIVDELDEDFYNSIADFRQGFITMLSHVNFAGKISVKRLVNNAFEHTGRSGTFFSGGADGTFTVISHYDEKPALITICGSDIASDNLVAWANVQKQNNAIARSFAVSNFYIQGNAFDFLDRAGLTELIRPSKGDWFWCIQYGTGLIGKAAPYIYKHK